MPAVATRLERFEHAPANSDVQLLEASRRVDWRFLLPNPELGRVACLGICDQAHIRSLRMFSESLTHIEPRKARRGVAGQFDVVVSEPSHEMLRCASRLVRPAGFLYIEAYGLPWAAHRPQQGGRLSNLMGSRLWHPVGCVTAVKRLGFIGVQVYWNWPNFDTCTKIIPLNDQMALHYAFSPNGRSARLRQMFARVLLHSGLLAWTISCFSVVAQRCDK